MMTEAKQNAANPIDIHVGGRIRMSRRLLGLSQEDLGGALGLSCQQIHNYERGASRISASRLFDLSTVLRVPVAFFFEDVPLGDAGDAVPSAPVAAEHAMAGEIDPAASRETMEFVRAYYQISDSRVRKRIFELIKTAASSKWQHRAGAR